MRLLPPILLVLILLHTIRQKWRVNDTAATTSFWWALSAIGLMLLAALVQFVEPVGMKYRSALQYAGSVFLLTPFVDILGARRPGHRAWPWFVLLPLVLVLQWPALSQLAAENAEVPIEIPAPTFVGFVLIVVMGCGNFFGTSHTLACLMAATGIVLTALPTTEFIPSDNPWMFTAGCLFLFVAAYLVPSVPLPAIAKEKPGHTELWADFRDLFGLVWAKRVMDRVNQFAARESWPVQLTLDGFRPANSKANEQAESSQENTNLELNVTDRALEILCWVLRRFLDPPFLSRYVADSIVSRSLKSSRD